MAFSRTHALHALTASAALILTACGGGGSSATASNTTTATTTPPAASTSISTSTTPSTSATTSTASTTSSTTTTAPTTSSSTTTSTNECTPLVPKAGDSLTYASTMTSAGVNTALNTVYDYTSGSYASKPAIVLTQTSTVSGKASTSVSYIDPVTGAALGSGNSTETTITTYDPVDYESRMRNAISTVGQKATVSVKARISGADITSAFSTIGGGTALNVDYTFTMERLPNEAVAVGSTSYTTCKLQINAKVNNVSLEGGNPSNALYGLMFGTLSAIYAAPINTTAWMSNQVPSMVKATGSFTAMGSTATSTTVLTAVKLAGR